MGRAVETFLNTLVETVLIDSVVYYIQDDLEKNPHNRNPKYPLENQIFLLDPLHLVLHVRQLELHRRRLHLLLIEIVTI
jgi:hypothetical protein